MDPVTMAYYAAVCGALCLVGPRMGGAPARFLLGVCVGVGAAALLPALRRALGI